MSEYLTLMIRDVSALTILPLEQSHALQAIELLIRVAAWMQSVGPIVWTPRDLPIAAYVDHAKAGELIGGFYGADLVACMLLQPCGDLYWPEATAGEALYLHKLAVDRSAAGRGVGVAMVEWACEAAQARGVSAVRLDTLRTGPLPALYRSLGFALVGPGPRAFNGRMLVRMERRLAWPRSVY